MAWPVIPMMAPKWSHKLQLCLQICVNNVNNFVSISCSLTRPVGPALTLVWVFQFQFFIFDMPLFHVWYPNHVLLSAQYKSASPVHKEWGYLPHRERAPFIVIHYTVHEGTRVLLLLNFLFQNHPT